MDDYLYHYSTVCFYSLGLPLTSFIIWRFFHKEQAPACEPAFEYMGFYVADTIRWIQAFTDFNF